MRKAYGLTLAELRFFDRAKYEKEDYDTVISLENEFQEAIDGLMFMSDPFRFEELWDYYTEEIRQPGDFETLWEYYHEQMLAVASRGEFDLEALPNYGPGTYC
jgi:hypothetical protein